jgi:hypothetical protein
MWGLVKPMIHPNTQRKVRILSKKDVLRGLQEHIDIDQIPEYYGGNARCSPPSDMDAVAEVGKDSCRSIFSVSAVLRLSLHSLTHSFTFSLMPQVLRQGDAGHERVRPQVEREGVSSGEYTRYVLSIYTVLVIPCT